MNLRYILMTNENVTYTLWYVNKTIIKGKCLGLKYVSERKDEN